MNYDFRKTRPESASIDKIKIIEGNSLTLANGLKVFFVNAGTSEVIKLDIVFKAGTREQSQNAVAAATINMLTEGTQTRTARQIADELDYYGAYLQTRCSADDSVLSLFCLKKHLSSCLPYLIDITQNPLFPENELNIYKKNAVQRLSVNMQRGAFVVRRLFYSAIFGAKHPYGTFSESIDYEHISRETLRGFFDSKIRIGIKYILVSGNVDDNILNLLSMRFADSGVNSEKATKLADRQPSETPIFLNKTDTIQSAIRIGRGLFSRRHPDFQKLQILNLVLGGYFGSRLMKNIREEKGLTYGILSAVESFQDDGCFYIETEINNDLVDTGLREIYREIERLKTTLIEEEELSMAKNYLLGSFLRSIDGPFSLSERQKILIDFGFDYEYYYKFIDLIKNISAKDLLELANNYFSKDTLSEVVVGNRK